ncbi:protein FAR-RED IMPAIRED RESPONSE 1-like [Arachis hypogaea]|uniref:protein FAR-RED IMPAIRED RESPONSE 1-like n=2 Tax=Arachis TaxID=3817 RepID=UPI0007AFAE81|nr:protein FAR-RED IMPAIRED RESPONSE 1-like [Arachis hypogaea]
MAFVIDLKTQSSSEEIHSFDTHIDMDNINSCDSSSNSAIETECTTEVLIHPTISDEEIPKVGMLFGTLEEARQFYYNYVNKVGFEPHIRNTNFDKNGRTPINQSIQCNRDGYRTKKNPVTQRSNTVSSVHCKARIYVKFDTELRKWRLSKVELAHTHRCDPSLSWMFKKNRELSMHVKDVIERNDQVGIRPSKTFQALAEEAGGRSNLKFLEKNVRNYISGKLRINGDDTDAQEMLDYFTRMKEQNPNFFYDICVYGDNSLKHAFWAHARSRAAYKYFSDVVSFDTTYKLNKYEMPVAAFMGVNQHGRSCLFGCALLGNEETEFFEWLMQTFIKCMGKTLDGILTDQCGAMATAIRNVMPNTRHRLCIWHITRKIPHKLGKLSRYEEIKATMHGIIWESRSQESFESSWYDFIEEYTLHDNNWLNVDNRGLIPCVSNSPIEKQFQHVYTNCIFRDVQTKFIKKCDCNLSSRVVKDNQYFYEVTQQKIIKGMSVYSKYEVVFCPISHQVRCNCFRFESYGILCCHVLSVLSHCRVDKVNSSYILSQWSKNVYRKHTQIRSSHESQRSDESMNIFRGLCVDFYNVAQDFVHDKEEADILRSAFVSAKVALSEHRAKHSKSVRTSECPDGLNALRSPPHVVPRGRPSFKRLEADLDRKIKNGTKKRRASSKHTKEVAAVEGDKHLNKATERRITASKHPKLYFSVYC